MKVIWGFDNPPQIRNGVATVGSYDGVHSGHRILLDEVVRRAKASEGESVVLTFEPHPRITLGNDEGLRLLSSFDEKCHLLEQVGIDYVAKLEVSLIICMYGDIFQFSPFRAYPQIPPFCFNIPKSRWIRLVTKC